MSPGVTRFASGLPISEWYCRFTRLPGFEARQCCQAPTPKTCVRPQPWHRARRGVNRVPVPSSLRTWRWRAPTRPEHHRNQGRPARPQSARSGGAPFWREGSPFGLAFGAASGLVPVKQRQDLQVFRASC